MALNFFSIHIWYISIYLKHYYFSKYKITFRKQNLLAMFFGVPVKNETKSTKTKPTETKKQLEIEIEQYEIKVNWYICNYSSVRNNMVKLQMVPGSSRKGALAI